MKKIKYTLFALTLITFKLLLLWSPLKAEDNDFPTNKDLNKAIKYINQHHEQNNYFGDNFNINETDKKVIFNRGKFTQNDRLEYLVYMPCQDESAPPDVEFSDFGVLFYKENDKWQFVHDYLDIDSVFILDFDNDGILELYTENSWFKMGEIGIYHAIYSFKSGQLTTLYDKTTDDFDEKVDETEEPDYSYLNQEQRYLYEFEFKKNPDNTTNLIETYKIGTLIKYRTKTKENQYKYKTTITNYALKNGKFVKVNNSKNKKSNKSKN